MSNTATAPAAISIRQTTATSKWLGAKSLGSGKEIAAGDQVVMCPQCYKPVLLDDWRGNDNKCPEDQTPGRVIERPGRGDGAAAAPAAPAEAAAAPAAAAPRAAAATPAAAPTAAVAAVSGPAAAN